MIRVVNYNYSITEVRTSEVMDIKSIASLKASSKELSNNATLEEIDLQTSEIPKSETRVEDNEENTKISEVKTSKFLTHTLLKKPKPGGRKNQL